jgi:hypothetical protein
MGGACTTAAASGPGAQSFYELSALDVDGNMFNFADLKGKVCLHPQRIVLHFSALHD